MRFSRKFKDGRLVATLLPTGIHIRAVERLDEVASVVPLPVDLPASAVICFLWSPTSQRLLLATSDLVMVAAVDPPAGKEPFRAVIRNPTLPVTAKPTFVSLCPSDDCVCICSAFGVKFVVFDLRTGQGVAIESPKFFSSAAVCSRGVSFRPATHHMALLVRTDGKDFVCLRDLVASAPVVTWELDTIDAQGLVWSPDGRWLTVWESPAHGHKVLFYTPDGHLFKTWTGAASGITARLPKLTSDSEARQDASSSGTDAETSAADELFGSGVRLVQFSANARHLAVGDASRTIRIIDMATVTTSMRLVHPTSIRPRVGSSLLTWQEQIDPVVADTGHIFVEATHDVSPPGRPVASSIDSTTVSSGCTLMAFDSSSTLLATRIEEAPSTVWVWSLETAELCSVLMLHANVSTVVWQPTTPHTLLVTCEGDKHRGLGVVWNPLKDTPPQAANFAPYYPPSFNQGHSSLSGQPAGKYRPAWLDLKGIPPSLFYSDANEFCLVALDEGDYHEYKATDSIPWSEAEAPLATTFLGGKRWAIDDRVREESPLELVPAGVDIEGDSEVDDTFHYKKED
ncbi:hypothetical protein SCUCBS95973_004638 [Sporothrix curviconia]|uniref:WD40 domain-containing protein n=1 Tax=Sporothrix curviconia TaxID=1260050 RepID=A0ABP0BQQ7_9PEZI